MVARGLASQQSPVISITIAKTEGCRSSIVPPLVSLDSNLPEGATAHSTYGISVLDDEELTCAVTPLSMAGRRIAEAHVLQWDEFPMARRSAWEAVLRPLDVLKESLKETYVSKIIICYGGFARFSQSSGEALDEDSVDLVNIRLILPDSSVVRKPFLKFAEKYSSIVSVAGAESTPAALPKRRPAPKARPVKEVMKKVMKKARK